MQTWSMPIDFSNVIVPELLLKVWDDAPRHNGSEKAQKCDGECPTSPQGRVWMDERSS